MAIPSTFQVPLGDLARKKGRNLLILSLVSLAIIKAGMVPQQVAAFGIDFDSADQSLLLAVLLVILVYSFLGFVIYGTFDFMDNRAALYDQKLREHSEKLAQKSLEPTKENLAASVSSPVRYYLNRRDKHWLYRPLFFIRVLYDCFLPISAGLYSIWALTWAVIEV